MSYMMSYTIWNTISHTLRHDIFHISCMLLKQDMPERSITECLSWYIPSFFGSNFGYKAWQLVGLFSLAGKLSIRIEWSSVRVLSMIYWVTMVEVEQKVDNAFFLVCSLYCRPCTSPPQTWFFFPTATLHMTLYMMSYTTSDAMSYAMLI